MKRALSILGLASLLLWTAVGLAAWANVARRVHVSFVDDGATGERSSELAALADELRALQRDVRALAGALGDNFAGLGEEIASRQAEQTAAVERALAGLRSTLATTAALAPGTSRGQERIAAGLAGPSPLPRGSAPDGGGDLPEAPPAGAGGAELAGTAGEGQVAELSTASEQPALAAGRKSFLAFRLPSDEQRLDERCTWMVLPALSRVGFDARSTLHDFSGVTSRLEGEFEVDLSHPADRPRALIRVQAASLGTGVEGRDEAMRERLAVDRFPEFVFELERFAPDTLTLEPLRVEWRVIGRLTIHGVERELAMPVELSLDGARRLCIEGETALRLSDHQITAPSKLGMISMQDEVRIWISLRARPLAREEG